MTRPRIAVLMDENTSTGGSRYEAHKGFFHLLIDAGAAPFGVAYDLRLVDEITSTFDGLLTAGGRFALPSDWYAQAANPGVNTDRLAFETALVQRFLAARKPVLGMCAGMQTLACLNGARLIPQIDDHDGGAMHEIVIAPGTRLYEMVGPRLNVNSHHREAISELPPSVVASARSPDGVIEATEIPAHRFAVGLQWHQELLHADHPGAAIFDAFVRTAA